MIKINFKKSMEVINKNKIIISTILLMSCIGIYYAFSRYIHTLPFPEVLSVLLIPLVLICGSGIWGDNGIFSSTLFCYSDLTIVITFAIEGFILGWFIQLLINKFKNKKK